MLRLALSGGDRYIDQKGLTLNPGKPKRIYTTYTAMTALRKLMSGLALGQDQEAVA